MRPDGTPIEGGLAWVEWHWVEWHSTEFGPVHSLVHRISTESGRFFFEVPSVPVSQNAVYCRLSWLADAHTWPNEEAIPTASWYLRGPIAPATDKGDVALPIVHDEPLDPSLSDGELQSQFRTSIELMRLGGNCDLDLLHSRLRQLTHRNGPQWDAILEEMLALDRPIRERKYVLDVLTVLRRRQGKPDPLTVRVSPHSKLVVAAPEKPVLVVELLNTDIDHVPVYVYDEISLANGAPWRLEARGIDGVPLTRVRDFVLGYSGVHGLIALEPGAAFEVELPLEGVFEGLVPGRFELRASFEDELGFGNAWDVDGQIVFHSPVVTAEIRAN